MTSPLSFLSTPGIFSWALRIDEVVSTHSHFAGRENLNSPTGNEVGASPACTVCPSTTKVRTENTFVNRIRITGRRLEPVVACQSLRAHPILPATPNSSGVRRAQFRSHPLIAFQRGPWYTLARSEWFPALRGLSWLALLRGFHHRLPTFPAGNSQDRT